MSNLIFHAQNELDAIGMTANDPDSMNVQMREHILLMVGVFAQEGHSGYSANYAADIISKLLKYEPLCPLTGNDNEWVDVAEQNGGPLWQNKRCSHVFKDNVCAYDIDGIVFYDIAIDDEGKPFKSYYTGRDSRVTINFPYTPERKYVETPKV